MNQSAIGGCCGTAAFGNVGGLLRQHAKKAPKNRERRVIEEFKRQFTTTQLKTVILTDPQLRKFPWVKPILRKLGFKPVRRWKNYANWCNLFVSTQGCNVEASTGMLSD